MDGKYIDIKKEIYKVKKFNPDKKCKKGFAYIKGKYVYPFMGEPNDEKNKVGVYYTEENGYKFIRPLNKKKADKYHIQNIYEINTDSINTIIKHEGVSDLDLDVILGETNDVFTPKISDQDNAMQRLIKEALELKQVDIKNYLGRFRDAGDLSNYKRALLHHGKMSLEKFIKWCNVLDLDYKITISDKKGAPNPMGQDIEGF